MRLATDTQVAIPDRYRSVGVGRQGHLVARPAPPVPGPGGEEPAGAVSGVGR
jgi:hypothetical protein